MGNDWDQRMGRAAELSDRPNRDREGHLPAYGEGPPDAVDVDKLPVNVVGTDSAMRWPELRSAQEAARRANNLEVPTPEASGDGTPSNEDDGEGTET